MLEHLFVSTDQLEKLPRWCLPVVWTLVAFTHTPGSEEGDNVSLDCLILILQWVTRL